MNAKLVTLYLLGQVLSVFSAGVALFWSAGRIDWWPAWAVIVVWLVWFTAMDSIVLRSGPGLMAERLAPPKGAKAWDRVVLSILRLTQLARYILAGLTAVWLDGRLSFGRSIVALVVCFLSTALFAWAMSSNAFFSQVVRVQSDSGHVVATGGPYRYVRHPAYTGTILFEFALSTLLASWWAIITGALCALLLVLRTVFEDRTLQAELAGYGDYSRQVRYRLLPGIW